MLNKILVNISFWQIKIWFKSDNHADQQIELRCLSTFLNLKIGLLMLNL